MAVRRADAVRQARFPGLIPGTSQAAGRLSTANWYLVIIFLPPSLDERASWAGRRRYTLRVLQTQFRLQSVRRMISLMNTVGLAMRDGLAHQTHFQE